MTNDSKDDLQHNAVKQESMSSAILVPGYELHEVIGRGGMGVVYRASDPQFDRDVAIKLLAGNVSADSFAATRFRNEARITGQLQHPGIPAVHELGTLADGRPFLAMKLVKGQTLRKLLEQRANPHEDRGQFIAIFEQLCHAVGYAHAHRVLHRDLKPSNVMVGAFGEVQVMDWGLAKVLGSNPTDDMEHDEDNQNTAAFLTNIDTPNAGSSATRTGSVLGTPAYMAPEQAGGEIRKLDARSDVFGLGAILCQILTGQPPYDGEDGNETRIKAVRGDLLDAFARLDSCGAELDLVGLTRKCLSFKQEDRPADGQAVADEVGRIRTQAESRARQAELERGAALVREAEQLRRRQQLMMAAAAVSVVLLMGIIGTTLGLFEARQQEKLAIKAREAEALRAEGERVAKLDAEAKQAEAERLKARAEAGEKRAEEEKQIARAVLDFLQYRLLNQANPWNQARILMKVGGQAALKEVKENPTIRELLDRAARELEPDKIDINFPKQPLVQAEILQTVGNTFRAVGDYEKAIDFLKRAEALWRHHLGPDHLSTLKSMNSLASAYLSARKRDVAIQLMKETLLLSKSKLGSDHPETLSIMDNLAMAYRNTENLNLALPLVEEAFKLRSAKLGPDHHDTLDSMNNLAILTKDAGKLDLALPLFEEVLKFNKAKYGPEHPATLLSMTNLAYAYRDSGKLELALPLFEESYIAAKKYNKQRPLGMYLAEEYARSKAFADAEPLLRKSLAIQEKEQPDDWMTFNTRSKLGGSLLGQKKYAAAEPLLLAGYNGIKKDAEKNPVAYASGSDRYKRLTEAIVRLVWLYRDTNKPDEAKKWETEKEKLAKSVQLKK